MASLEHWRRRPRETSGVFDPGPMEGKPALKTLEAEIHRQVQSLHSYFQRDLDLLHEQVHNEVYTALSQELVSVAQNLTAIRMEAHNSIEELRNSGGVLEQNLGGLMTVAERMREELNLTKAHAEGVRDVQADLQHLRERDLQQLQKDFQVSLKAVETAVEEEMIALRAETAAALCTRAVTTAALQGRATASSAEDLPQEFVARVAALEAKLPQVEQAAKEALGSEAAERATRDGELAMSVEVSRAEARKIAESLDASVKAFSTEIEEKLLNAEKRHEESKDNIVDIKKRLEEQVLSANADVVAESNAANARASKAAEAIAEQYGSLETRMSTLFREVDLQLDDARRDIRQLSSKCQEDSGFAHNCWTRTVDWMASIDLDKLERSGRFEVESPQFMAAGLRCLQLCLRLSSVEKPHGKPRWVCGAFLRGTEGQVSFRLHAAGKVQSFAGDFADTPEWGSQKIVTLESVGPTVPIRLEILDVTAEVPAQVGAPVELISTFQMTDAARVATREADKVRSSMVKRIEWRIVRISERIAAARAAVASGQAEREALEPLLSPTFSAGGLEGLQLQLYPLGYLRRDDAMPASNFEEKCGFFLVCPRGVYMKCRAFVGDQVKIFEHQYAEREPYGRPSFCRLMDKAGNDDCVLCGIEILDVRQELTTQVKGGPFGSIVDQMKVTLAPSLGSMEVMRELRDASDRGPRESMDRAARTGKQRHMNSQASEAYPGASIVAAALAPLGPALLLSNSESLPALLPEAGGKVAATGNHHGGGRGRTGSWPPTPGSSGSPAKQKMTKLPKI